jgi:hypothetical protein
MYSVLVVEERKEAGRRGIRQKRGRDPSLIEIYVVQSGAQGENR